MTRDEVLAFLREHTERPTPERLREMAQYFRDLAAKAKRRDAIATTKRQGAKQPRARM